MVGRFIDALVHPDTLHVSIHMMEYRYDERFYSDSLICVRYILLSGLQSDIFRARF